MNSMGREISILVPKDLRSDGTGVLAFSVEIEENEYRDYRRSCRVEGLPDSSDYTRSGSFSPVGLLTLTLPGGLAGEITPVLEIFHPTNGERLSGAFRLKIDRLMSSAVHVNTSGQSANGSGVIYQPIEVHGADAGPVEFVGSKVRIRVPLLREQSKDAVPLQDLIERPEFLVMPARGDGITRVMQVNLGRQIVLGRCFGSQLRSQAGERLKRQGASAVDWVTWWDDLKINQISASLLHKPDATECHLWVTNLTDYSRHRSPLILHHLHDRHEVGPGEENRVVVANESVISIVAGEGTDSRQLVKFCFEEIPAQDTVVPVYRTQDTTFRWPPEGGTESTMIHFLGVWIPIDCQALGQLLRCTGEPLHITFPVDDVSLWLSWSKKRKSVMASSNENLRQSLANG